MAEQTIIKKTSTAGQAIEIRIAPQWEGSSYIGVYGYLDGQRIGTGITTFGLAKTINGQRYVAAVGKLALTEAECKVLDDAIKAAELATEEGRIRLLRQEREQLVLRVRGAQDGVMAARERAFDEDTGALWPEVAEAEEAERTARQALKDWDTEHPEVIAAINAEARADAERRLWD
jgi:multidrug resistance efflux pump